MTELLFHGSTHVVGKPIFGQGKPFNDYGLGFYCTRVRDMAREWAATSTSDGFVNCYEMDSNGYDVLDLCGPEYSVLHWLAVLLENREFALNTQLALAAREYITREFAVDYSSRDLIVGYRADDSYFSFAKAFLNGSITYQQLSCAMRLGNLGIQVVLKSRQAFDAIRFVNAEPVESRLWYPRRHARDEAARLDYRKMTARFDSNGVFVTDILRQQMGADDERLR